MIIPNNINCLSRGSCYSCPQRQFCSIKSFTTNPITRAINPITRTVNPTTRTTNSVSDTKVADKIVEFTQSKNSYEDLKDSYNTLKDSYNTLKDSYETLKTSYGTLESKITKLLYKTEEVSEQYFLLNLKMDYVISGGKKLPEIKVTSYVKEGERVVYNLEKDPEVYSINNNFVLKFVKINTEETKEAVVKYFNKEYEIAPEFIQEVIQAYLDGNTIRPLNIPEQTITSEQLITYDGPILEEKKGLFGRRKWKEAK